MPRVAKVGRNSVLAFFAEQHTTNSIFDFWWARVELYLLDEARYLNGHILPGPPHEAYIRLVVFLENDILGIERYLGKYLMGTFDHLNVHIERP